MHLEINHTTCYTYSQPVFLEPQILRFCPRSGPAQRLDLFEMDITPEPTGLTHFLDIEGNPLTKVWFDDVHREFQISIRSRVTTFRVNPFDFLLEGDDHFPVSFSERDCRLLTPALYREAGETDEVLTWATELQGKAERQLIPFLQLLNQTLHESFEVIHRERGAAWSAEATLRERRGACRDLAVLFVDACRAVGLPGRFVSGYYQVDASEEPELHAWAEVYLPGAGWRGYDPTQNLAVTQYHVALAASVCPELAAPVSGSFRGSAESTFQSTIQIRSASHSFS